MLAIAAAHPDTVPQLQQIVDVLASASAGAGAGLPTSPSAPAVTGTTQSGDGAAVAPAPVPAAFTGFITGQQRMFIAPRGKFDVDVLEDELRMFGAKDAHFQIKRSEVTHIFRVTTAPAGPKVGDVLNIRRSFFSLFAREFVELSPS